MNSISTQEKDIIQNNIHLKHKKNQYVDYKNKICLKPWGHEFLSYESTKIAIWVLTIKRNHKTSLHAHFNKDTTLIVLQGCARIKLIDHEFILPTMGIFNIPMSKFHSIESVSDTVTIAEVESFSSEVTFSDKNDVLRIDDIYIREKTGYEKSVQISEELDKYNYFYLHNTFENNFMKVITNIHNISQNNIYILLNGIMNMSGLYIKEGSIIDYDIMQKCVVTDDVMVLEIKKELYEEDSKIIYNLEHLKMIVSECNKHTNNKLILTSGCFDIIHVGHMHNLKQAKMHGDKLFVCLSSDKQIKALKGISRPINNYHDRIQLFKTIKYVDYIILYDEEDIQNEATLDKIMNIVNPYYWVKGSDYKKEDILNKHPSVNIKIIENIPHISTTHIISHITNT